MKTPEYYLDEVAKEYGYNSYEDSSWIENLSIVKEAMLRHSKEALDERNDLYDKISSLNGYLKLCIEGKFPRELPAVIAECDEFLLKHQ